LIALQKLCWSLFSLVIFALGLYLRWSVPAPEWQYVGERAFILHPLGFGSGDLNAHFINYPTLHFYFYDETGQWDHARIFAQSFGFRVQASESRRDSPFTRQR